MLWYRTLLLSLVLLPVVAAAAAAQSNDLPPGVWTQLADAIAATVLRAEHD